MGRKRLDSKSPDARGNALLRVLITAHKEVLQGSRQKSRLLPAATKLLSEKSAAGDFFPMYQSQC
jgi:hypothetical protein